MMRCSELDESIRRMSTEEIEEMVEDQEHMASLESAHTACGTRAEGKARYSPGPWRLDEDWNVRCPCAGFEDMREADGRICTVGYRPNGQLIAAAPELLEALRNLVDRTEGGGPDVPLMALWDNARAALAKATGQ